MPSRPWHTSRVATPPATIVQLARYLDVGALERCLDHCLAERLASVAAVRDVIDRLPPTAAPGRANLLELLAARDGGIGHRSGLEQAVRAWLDDAGLTGWRRNHRVPVGDGRTVEVDFAWLDARVALEVSPFYTHGSRPQQETDIVRRRLLTRAGWRVAEATDPDLVDRRAFTDVIATLNELGVRALRWPHTNTAHRVA